MAETTGLLNRRTSKGYRGFESRRLRKILKENSHGVWRSPVSAPVLGTGGRRFESCHPDFFFLKDYKLCLWSFFVWGYEEALFNSYAESAHLLWLFLKS